MVVDNGIDWKKNLFHFDESGSGGGAIGVETVTLLKHETEEAFQSSIL